MAWYSVKAQGQLYLYCYIPNNPGACVRYLDFMLVNSVCA